MYFYYFRETKDSNGYGTIRSAKILWHSCAMQERWSFNKGYYIIQLDDIMVKVDPTEFELPKYTRKYKHKNMEQKERMWDYNTICMSVVEGQIRNRTFWLFKHDPKRAQKIVDDYYKEKMEKEVKKYTKRINSKIEIKRG